MKLPAFMLAGCLALAACSSSAGESIAGLGLSGRLVYTQGQEGLWQIDLKSGEIQQLGRLPEGGQRPVSPSRRMGWTWRSHTPHPGATRPFFGRTSTWRTAMARTWPPCSSIEGCMKRSITRPGRQMASGWPSCIWVDYL